MNSDLLQTEGYLKIYNFTIHHYQYIEEKMEREDVNIDEKCQIIFVHNLINQLKIIKENLSLWNSL
ncbi:unnamed protein product [Paramecium primaurelia]|uniref:Uncharacterized protein n=1 Tax=Paramecium primaurelia TaxID=5886 RepID=A0A8S1PC54_PARPR|nr:unnamed protein product [Paramecium primaurelia]